MSWLPGTEVVGLLEEERALVTRVREGSSARLKEAEKRMADERQAHLSSTQQLAHHNAELQQEVKVSGQGLYQMIVYSHCITSLQNKYRD